MFSVIAIFLCLPLPMSIFLIPRLILCFINFIIVDNSLLDDKVSIGILKINKSFAAYNDSVSPGLYFFTSFK